jgi:ABC-type branched-subunit amino acid transport system permease subunit
MKSFIATVAGALSLFTTGVSSAQPMMNGANGGMWGSGWMGGYGIPWGPILLVVVVGLVVWVVLQKRK